MDHSKIVVGAEEWCVLPELGLPFIKARIDSGAKTSCLHAFNIQPFEENGQKFVRFDVHPLQGTRKCTKTCVAPVLEKRVVKSSNGALEKRYVIQTTLLLGGNQWPVEISLTNRDTMGYRMLLGRQAMLGKIIVDPSRSFCCHYMDDAEARRYYKTATQRKVGLKLLLLATDPNLYSNRRLMEAAEMRGHSIEFLNTKDCWISVNAEGSSIYHKGGRIVGRVDCVIPRLRPSMTFYGCSLLRQIQASGAFCVNDASSIVKASDKLHSLQLLSSKGIVIPTTGFAHTPQDSKSMIATLGGAPLVIKLLEGTQGTGVVLAETRQAAESVVGAFKSLKAHILVQEFIKEARGKDLRCFVIDGKVVAAVERQAQEGEFRANIHLGGTCKEVKLSLEEKKIASMAAKAVGLKVAGVDLIRSDSGPKVLEVNASPGLEGIEKATGKDIAGLIMNYIEKRISPLDLSH